MEAFAATWDRIAPLLPSIGVTRVADLTGLDRLGIPVVQAIMPRSADTISTYAGKGLTLLAAKVSAAMEAVERYCASRPRRPDVVASVKQLRIRGVNLLDPRDTNLELHPDYRDDGEIEWLWGVDLVAEREILVPLGQAADCWKVTGPPVVVLATSNGLASGNSEAEAVIHGLNEVVERDAWTIADVLAVRLARLLERRLGGPVHLGTPILAALDVAGSSTAVQDLVGRFTGLGLELELSVVETDLAVPTVVATTTDTDAHGLSVAHEGLGTDADPEVAAIRALTEVAQSRAGDISGIREDLTLATDIVPPWLTHNHRGDTAPRRWHAVESRRLSDMSGFATDDVVADLVETVRRLTDAGLDRVVVVDLAQPDVPAAVCRVLVPGAESWGADHSKLGRRAVAAWNVALAGAGRQ